MWASGYPGIRMMEKIITAVLPKKTFSAGMIAQVSIV
jgi:hypothetical protein